MTDLDWLSRRPTLSLAHYSPIYGDDDDQSVEWRVSQQTGSINDREWDIVGRGASAETAIRNAREFFHDTEPALTSPPPQGWRDIESAPSMKTILLYADTSTADLHNWRMGTGYKANDGAIIWEGRVIPPWDHPPTHWQPLPAAPLSTAPAPSSPKES